MILRTEQIYLRILRVEDASPDYVSWMNDYNITRFLETRWRYQDQESIDAFIRDTNASPNDFLFGIFRTDSDQHIGNIKIGNVNWLHRYADVGLLVGDTASHGRGYATQAISLVTRYAFESLNLHSLTAGAYAGNEGSARAFLKAGWSEAGKLRQHVFLEGKYVDVHLLEIVKPDQMPA